MSLVTVCVKVSLVMVVTLKLLVLKGCPLPLVVALNSFLLKVAMALEVPAALVVCLQVVLSYTVLQVSASLLEGLATQKTVPVIMPLVVAGKGASGTQCVSGRDA